MNIIQLHEKIDFLLDKVRSPRLTRIVRDNSINTSVDEIVRDRYDNIKNQKTYSIQSKQRLRDELYTLIKKSNPITINSLNIVPISSFPSDYSYLLDINATISGNVYNCVPTTYDEIEVLKDNPHEVPQISEPDRVYYIESESGILIEFGSTGVAQTALLDYLSKPVSIYSGIQIDSTYTATANTLMIATSVVEYPGGTIIPIGNEFTLLSGQAIVSGTAVHSFVNTDLPNNMHEEIAKKASALITKTLDNFGKSQALEIEANKS